MIGSGLLGLFKQTSHRIAVNSSAPSNTLSTLSRRIIENGLSSLNLNASKPSITSQIQLLQPSRLVQPLNSAQNRFNWGYKGRMMLKDIKRRELLKKYAPVRIRLQTLRANSVLPKILKKSAEEQLQKLVYGSSLTYLTNRCGFTSKAGGCLHRWRLSRHVWRDLADYNHLSGVTRAVWGTPTRNAAHFTFRGARRSWFNYDGYRPIEVLNHEGKTVKMRFKLN